MSARPLSEAVQQAEAAITGRDFDLAVETCRRVLGQFPEFATAYRLLGEAYLEQGDNASAEQYFHETLQRDPQSLAAYAGLGTVAENRGDLQTALAYSQVAWEIAPQRIDLRDQVARLSEKLYGAGGRLHLTRAALASLHYYGGRWSRAAAECAAVLLEYPGRVDVQVRLAEALWRRGSDDKAADNCRLVLDRNPNVVVALLILADIERRQGKQDSASSLLSRARSVDPDGVRAADLIMVGSDDLADFLLPTELSVLEDRPEAAPEPERPKIAPAPDFSTPPIVAAQQPMDTAGGVDDGMPDLSLPDDAEINAARPPSYPQVGYTDVLESLEHEGLSPFSFGEAETEEEPEENVAAFEEDLFSLASNDDIEAARPSEEQLGGYTSLLRSLDEGGLEPFAIDVQSGPRAESNLESAALLEVEGDDLVEEQIAPVTPAEPGTPEPIEDSLAALTSDWDAIDQEIQRATPGATPGGFTSELQALDETGIEPFSFEPEEQPAVEAQADEIQLEDREVAPEPEPEIEPELSATIDADDGGDDLMADWDTIDQEILGAIPTDSVAGVTDELKALDESGLVPFSFEDVMSSSSDTLEVPSVDELMDDIFENDEPDLLAVADDAPPAEPPRPQVKSGGISETDLLGFDDIYEPEELMAEPPVTAEPESPPDLFESESFDTVIDMDTVAEQQQPELADDLLVTSADLSQADATDTQGIYKLQQAISRLGVDAELFQRARLAKVDLVQAGQIEGEGYLPGTEPKGPTMEELQSQVDENPYDTDARLALSQSLADSGDGGRALEQYRWLFRQAGFTSGEIISGVSALADEGGEIGIQSHRLLGALYRKSGNLALSASHYQLSLEGYRQQRAGR